MLYAGQNENVGRYQQDQDHEADDSDGPAKAQVGAIEELIQHDGPNNSTESAT